MSTEEQKPETQRDEATNEARVITSQASVDNELIPPLGTMYYSRQTIDFFDNQTFSYVMGMNVPPMNWGTLSWSADVYTYGTGGVPPTDDNFANDGGLIYIVMVHRVTVSVFSSFSPDSWNTMKFGLRWNDSNLTPVYQLPSTGSEEISGDNYNYEIDFVQAMQMLQNLGNQATTFDAKYGQTFSLAQATQTGVAATGVEFQIKTVTSSSEHSFTQTSALSMLTHPNPGQFPVSIEADFSIDAWSEEALDNIWRAVQLHDLLQLLAPLNSDGTQFARAIHLSDWARFNKYACRVRSLTIGIGYTYGKEIFEDTLLSRLSLPRLIELKLFHPLSPHSVSLLRHSPIQILRIGNRAINTLLGQDATVTLGDIPISMPGLRVISIRTNRDVSFMAERVAQAVRDMKALQEVDIPPCLLTNHVISALASLPRLKSLKTTWPGNLSYRPSTSPLPQSARLTSLETLHLSQRKAIAWLAQSAFPSGLSHLKISSTPIEGGPTIGEYSDMVQKIASQCQQLVIMSLHFLSPLSFRVLEPILSLSTLESLKLVCMFDPGMEHTHLLMICQRLPSLRVLDITIGLRISRSSLDFSVLAELSSIARNLAFLKFHFNALSEVVAEDVLPFAKLQTLDLTASTITATERVASFLSRVLPEWCAIQCGSNGAAQDVAKELDARRGAMERTRSGHGANEGTVQDA
ncbi:hypothetical protein EYR40_008418 [Pleurotus pulmonarius]|nr:hypothetical protein EYR40_008418 [Pleurotus pulmonarius]